MQEAGLKTERGVLAFAEFEDSDTEGQNEEPKDLLQQVREEVGFYLKERV